jgi:hypothetical protein
MINKKEAPEVHPAARPEAQVVDPMTTPHSINEPPGSDVTPAPDKKQEGQLHPAVEKKPEEHHDDDPKHRGKR